MPKVNDIEYINVWDYHKESYPFNIFIGGRGCGKTYSSLRGAVEKGDQFIYMRRLSTELEMNSDPESEDLNPFSWLNEDFGWNYGLTMINKRVAGIYNRITTDDGLKPSGEPIGYGLALSTLAKLRGINLMKSRYWLYDEFIKERHVARMKGECDALLNAYMSLNRNREHIGEPPIYLDLCSNSTDIYNDIFVGLGIVLEVEKMIAKKVYDFYIPDRGLGIHLLKDSKSFKAAQERTALAKLTKGTRFYDSTFENQFSYNDFSLVKYVNLKGWRPLAKFKSDISNCRGCIYASKGDRLLHVSYADSTCTEYNLDLTHDNTLFRQRVGVRLHNPYIHGKLTFESYQLKSIILENIF